MPSNCLTVPLGSSKNMALASDSSRSSVRSRKTGRSRSRSRQTTPLAAASVNVRSLPSRQSPALPPKLQFLQTLQQTFSGLTFALVCGALGMYAWTVYAPTLWSREYRKLESLQQHERHLTAANETLKNQLARQAEQPNSGLAKTHPQHNIFIPAVPSPPLPPPSPERVSPPSSPVITQPLAY